MKTVKNLIRLALLALSAAAASCTGAKGPDVPFYVWQTVGENFSADSLKADFERYKVHGCTGVCISAGLDTVRIARCAGIARECGLEYHAWITAMLHDGMPHDWYAVNRLGESADEHPAYVDRYKALDPNKPEVAAWLADICRQVAAIPEVDFVQLDYIRYPDVILARGLWDKYGLTMDEEYPAADYCYCDACVAQFRAEYGIDIRSVEDPAKVAEWARFRCDVITQLVDTCAQVVHDAGKKISADVFPGPYSNAVWMVRQQWDQWNIDVAFPMNYNDFYLEGPSWVGKVAKEEVEKAEGRMKVVSGLFICPDWRKKAQVEDPEYAGLLPSEMEEAVRGSLEAGADGICLFTPERMSAEHWEALDEALRAWKKH